MGTLTGTNIDTDVRAILGAVNTDLLPTATLLRHTNAAYRTDICSRADLDELDKVATVSATSTGTVVLGMSDLLAIKGITNAAGTLMREVTVDEFNRLTGRVSATGSPLYWYRTSTSTSGAGAIYYYPRPASSETITISYKLRPAEVAAGTATVVDVLYDEPLVYYTASRSAAYLRMYEDAMSLRKYADMLFDAALGTQKMKTPRRGSPGHKPRTLVNPPDPGTGGA